MKHQKKAIAFVLTLALVFSPFMTKGTSYGAEAMGTVGESNVAFSDIDGHWGEKDIENAVKSGFVKGYEDGTFKPNKTVSRAEFVTMINKALQLRDENTVNLLFQDVKETAWYYKDIQKASYAKYVNGISDTSFMPNKNITREEAAAMLAGFLPKAGYQEATTLNAYSDAGQVSNWAKEAIAVVINKGYLTGYANGKLVPKGNLTRAEAAKTIGKILDKETIVREDVSLKTTGETLKDKIYVGDITIEKSVGEGEASLENLSALSKVYVEGGGTNTVTISNSTVIQLIVCKEGTKVRVLSDGSTIYQAFVFNGNLLVDKQGQSAKVAANGYKNIIYLNGTVTADTAIRIATEIAKKIDDTGKVTKEQVSQGVAAVMTGSAITVNDDGSIAATVPSTSTETDSKAGRHSHNSNNNGNDGYEQTTVNGLPATVSAITGDTCTCGLPLTSTGAFTKAVEFDSDGIAGGQTVTGYAIYTEAQLQHLAMHLNDNAVLMKDLDFSEIAPGLDVLSSPMGALKIASEAELYTKGRDISKFVNGNFVPIGGSSNQYTGIFCGNGKSITGLIISDSTSNNVGLFGYTSGAAIKDLTLSGGAITGKNNVGSAVGNSGYETIVKGICNTGTVNGAAYLGGVVGKQDKGAVSGSHNTGTVSGTGGVIGGVVGGNYNGGTVSNSYNMGEIASTNTTGMNMGGVAGSNVGTISSSYNTGAVNGKYDHVGGVAGSNSGVVSDSYNTGAVTGGWFIGGVVGVNSGVVSDSYNTGTASGEKNVGGVVGENYSDIANSNIVIISSSYNTGAVNGTGDYVGGVVGQNYSDIVNSNIVIISSSYNTGAVNGTGDYVGGVVGFIGNGTVNGYWMDGSNLKNMGGIGHGSGDTATFSAIDATISAIYSSMSAITESAGDVATGVITDMTFGESNVNPEAFSALQGSYILTGSSLTLTVNGIPGSTMSVTTGTALVTLIMPGGMAVTPQSSEGNIYTYSLSGLESGTWILVRAVDSENSKLNRIYTLYIK